MTYSMLVADPMSSALALFALLWIAAKLGGELAIRLKLPAVAGQITAGALLAAMPKLFSQLPNSLGIFKSPEMLRFLNIAESPEAGVMAYIGVVLLMFFVGLESSVPQMMKVGWASLRVAVVGVAVPMALGLVAASFLTPQ